MVMENGLSMSVNLYQNDQSGKYYAQCGVG